MNKLLVLVIYFLLNVFAYAQEQSFSDWIVRGNAESEFIIASTANEDGTAAGIICSDSETCYPFVNVTTACEEDGTYPFLFSFDDGIVADNLSCLISGDVYLFIFKTDQIERMITSSKMGVAYGMADGNFKAAYFSLSGSTKAYLELQKRLDTFDKVAPKRGSQIL